ncbi:MAG: hypothetical protein ACRDUS_06265 [Mycobacterium sp.]
MTNPWASLDADTQNKKLYLSSEAIPAIDKSWPPYEASLNALINDTLNDTRGFGTADNPLATALQNAFNARGTELNTYLTAQHTQAKGLTDTARDAAAAVSKTDQN